MKNLGSLIGQLARLLLLKLLLQVLVFAIKLAL